MAIPFSPDLGDKQHLGNRTIPRQRFRHDQALNAESSDWLILPAGIGDLMVTVVPSAGDARIEFTQAPIEDIEAGTVITGTPWPDGDVTVATQKLMANAVSAIRCVASAQTQWTVTA
ncbi:hypothetical protein [Marinobacter sp. W-8]|uniref:hypothetical protein n=1 Tax=Marinobacter sp. W-8 TaxID=3369658 RepID=UPI0037CA4532